MRRTAAVLLLVWTVGCASARPSLRDPWHVAAIGAAAADTATTHVALQQPGVVEANSAATAICGEDMNLGCMVAMKAGTIALFTYLENSMELEGWGKRILWMLPTTLWGGAAIWNAQFIW